MPYPFPYAYKPRQPVNALTREKENHHQRGARLDRGGPVPAVGLESGKETFNNTNTLCSVDGSGNSNDTSVSAATMPDRDFTRSKTDDDDIKRHDTYDPLPTSAALVVNSREAPLVIVTYSDESDDEMNNTDSQYDNNNEDKVNDTMSPARRDTNGTTSVLRETTDGRKWSHHDPHEYPIRTQQKQQQQQHARLQEAPDKTTALHNTNIDKSGGSNSSNGNSEEGSRGGSEETNESNAISQLHCTNNIRSNSAALHRGNNDDNNNNNTNRNDNNKNNGSGDSKERQERRQKNQHVSRRNCHHHCDGYRRPRACQQAPATDKTETIPPEFSAFYDDVCILNEERVLCNSNNNNHNNNNSNHKGIFAYHDSDDNGCGNNCRGGSGTLNIPDTPSATRRQVVLNGRGNAIANRFTPSDCLSNPSESPLMLCPSPFSTCEGISQQPTCHEQPSRFPSAPPLQALLSRSDELLSHSPHSRYLSALFSQQTDYDYAFMHQRLRRLRQGPHNLSPAGTTATTTSTFAGAWAAAEGRNEGRSRDDTIHTSGTHAVRTPSRTDPSAYHCRNTSSNDICVDMLSAETPVPPVPFLQRRQQQYEQKLKHQNLMNRRVARNSRITATEGKNNDNHRNSHSCTCGASAPRGAHTLHGTLSHRIPHEYSFHPAPRSVWDSVYP